MRSKAYFLHLVSISNFLGLTNKVIRQGINSLISTETPGSNLFLKSRQLTTSEQVDL